MLAPQGVAVELRKVSIWSFGFEKEESNENGIMNDSLANGISE